MRKVLIENDTCKQSDMMSAEIFIPTSNRIDALRNCLESLKIQSYQNFKIFLVGIEKNAQIQSMMENYKSLEVDYFIQNKKGIIGAANEALAKAKGDVFVRIDDDVVLSPDWLRNIIVTFESDEKIGGVTGPTIISEEGLGSRDLTAFLEKFQKSKNSFLKFINSIYLEYLYEGKMLEVSRFLKSGAFTLGSNYPECLEKQNQEVSNLEACNWSARTALVKKVGGFDEIFMKGIGDFHEADCALKIKEMGYKLIFNPKAKLQHKVEFGSVAKARPAPFWRIQNFFIFYSRHIGFKSSRHFFGFWANVLLQNGYYVFRFFSTGKINQLGAIPGTLVGVVRYFAKR